MVFILWIIMNNTPKEKHWMGNTPDFNNIILADSLMFYKSTFFNIYQLSFLYLYAILLYHSIILIKYNSCAQLGKGSKIYFINLVVRKPFQMWLTLVADLWRIGSLCKKNFRKITLMSVWDILWKIYGLQAFSLCGVNTMCLIFKD